MITLAGPDWALQTLGLLTMRLGAPEPSVVPRAHVGGWRWLRLEQPAAGAGERPGYVGGAHAHVGHACLEGRAAEGASAPPKLFDAPRPPLRCPTRR